MSPSVIVLVIAVVVVNCRSSIPELHRLPKQWLQEVMLDIRSGSPESKLCATRRSAGVPFYVQVRAVKLIVSTVQ